MARKKQDLTGRYVFMLMAGVFITFMGFGGYMKDSTNIYYTLFMIFGLVLTGNALYRILVPPGK